jgi:hypothetical protein
MIVSMEDSDAMKGIDRMPRPPELDRVLKAQAAYLPEAQRALARVGRFVEEHTLGERR